jgi:hypothetical protein
MPAKLATIFGLTLLAVLLVSACAAKPPKPTPAAPVAASASQAAVVEVKAATPLDAAKPIPVDRTGARAASVYWPLNLGNTWVYKRNFLGEEGTLTISILKRDAEGYYVDSAGGRLMSTPFGLRDPERYLLQAPVEKGQTWRAQLVPGRSELFEILEDDVTITVPAGRYEHCVVVRSTSPAPAGSRLINTVSYAPHVGMIRAETLVVNNQQRQARQVLLELMRAELP